LVLCFIAGGAALLVLVALNSGEPESPLLDVGDFGPAINAPSFSR
jgi:hypothetical protein